MSDDADNVTAPSEAPEPRYWLDDPRHVDWICYAVYLICPLLLLLDISVNGHGLYHKHVYFGIDGSFGFYGVYGFVAYISLVLVSIVLRKVVGRGEDYYD